MITTTNNPRVGDILALNASNEKVYIDLATYTSLPTGWTAVGVVAKRDGRKVLVAHKTNASKKWADAFIWELTGAAMTDGQSHTANFTANSVSVSVTWQTSTAEAFATALATAINNATFGTHTYRCIYEDGKVLVIHDTYTAWMEPSMSGITFNRAIGAQIPANSTSYRNSNKSIYWGAANFERYCEYAKTSGVTPTADEPLVIAVDRQAVKFAEFQTNAYCAAVRNAYCVDPSNPTYEDYKNYIWNAGWPIYWPDGRASLADKYRDGKAFTYAHAADTYLAKDGTRKPLYTAFDYCKSIAYNADGLRSGDWYLLSKWEMYPVWSKLTYGLSGITRANADALNRGLNAIGGSAISCESYSWSSARYPAYLAWIFYSLGLFGSNYFYASLLCVPFVLLTLPTAE